MKLIDWMNSFCYLTCDIPVAIHLDAYTTREAFIKNNFEYDMNVYVGSMENIPMWLGSYYMVNDQSYIEDGMLNIYISARNENM